MPSELRMPQRRDPFRIESVPEDDIQADPRTVQTGPPPQILCVKVKRRWSPFKYFPRGGGGGGDGGAAGRRRRIHVNGAAVAGCVGCTLDVALRVALYAAIAACSGDSCSTISTL